MVLIRVIVRPSVRYQIISSSYEHTVVTAAVGSKLDSPFCRLSAAMISLHCAQLLIRLCTCNINMRQNTPELISCRTRNHYSVAVNDIASVAYNKLGRQ